MALASLCSQMKDARASHSNVFPKLKFRAFIVDHAARSGSDTEAQNVSELLSRQGKFSHYLYEARTLTGSGIAAEILKINWAESQNPSELSNFENLARRYRFRALGLACKRLGIQSLFLAHHEDDQAETILMRMVAGHRVKGLTGIKAVSGIPECYGIYGVHESGGVEHPSRLQNEKKDDQTPPAWKPRFWAENGGVRLYRPLLSFSKARLITTCQENNVEWFEDHTNKDPALTRRNAIRHLYANYTLPAALQKPALLQMSRKFKEIEVERTKTTESWLAECKISQFDVGTGTVKVSFADLTQFKCSSGWPHDVSHIAAEMLRRIALLVSPRERIDLNTLHSAVNHVFPELLADDRLKLESAFTIGSVYFQPATPPAPTVKSEVKSAPIAEIDSDGKCEWLLCRQPMSNLEVENHTVAIPASKHTHTKSEWMLFDGRFWLRITNKSNDTLIVRTLSAVGFRWSEFGKTLEQPMWLKLQAALKHRAPGYVRWTLPAIIVRKADGEEQVVALPTLNVHVSGIRQIAKWDLRYKKIYTEGLVMPGNGRSDKTGTGAVVNISTS